MMRWTFLHVLMVAGLVAGAPVATASAQDASASANQSRLDRLFDSLAGSENPEEAKRIETNIEAIWLQSGSATADLLTRRALNAYQRNDYAAALTLLTAAIDAAPSHAEAYNKRATVYLVEGHVQRGLLDIRQALSLEPRHFGAWNSLGRVMEQLNDDAGALEAFRRSKALSPYQDDIDDTIERLELIVRGREI